MNKKFEAILVFIVTMVGSYGIADLIFSSVLDVYIVPLVGMRPLVAAFNAAIIMSLGYILVDSKYHFEKKGGKLFKK